jgi:hypothetical protein
MQEIKAKAPAPGSPFAVNIWGAFAIVEEGMYTFCVNSSDGSGVSQKTDLLWMFLWMLFT